MLMACLPGENSSVGRGDASGEGSGTPAINRD